MDETTDSTTEEIVGNVEGTVASLEVETNEAPDVVPARDLMALKDKNEKLKTQLKEEREARKAYENSRTADDSDDDLSKFSDVDPDFIRGLTARAKKEAIAEFRAELAQRDQKVSFDKKLDNTIDQQLEVARQNGVKVPSNVDKALLKSIALANPKIPISKLAENLWEIDIKAKATTENDARPASDYITESVDVDTISKEQLAKIWADPASRKAYLDKKYQ